jgi:hypothetical protein
VVGHGRDNGINNDHAVHRRSYLNGTFCTSQHEFLSQVDPVIIHNGAVPEHFCGVSVEVFNLCSSRQSAELGCSAPSHLGRSSSNHSKAELPIGCPPETAGKHISS